MIEQVKKYIKKKIASMTLFVLKGFSIDEIGTEPVFLQNTIDNKIMRVFNLSQQTQPIIVFDEFVCLYDMVVMQFKKICIIENPLYHNLFPVGALLSKEISQSLLDHFDEDSDEKAIVDTIDDYTLIYSKYIRTAGGIACCYGLSENQMLNDKIEIYKVPLPITPVPQNVNSSDTVEKINICNDVDLYELIQQLQSNSDRFSITWENYAAGKSAVESSLGRINSYFPNRLFKLKLSSVNKLNGNTSDTKDIMKKYWGYDNYREIEIYDLSSVEQKQKKIGRISQEQIIGNLIQQAENCI
ncbi:MAG: hypothetical protein LBR68_05240, partial [Lachnoclostridium sp.]|nr:hypothetical protein [Lachnoclostridium sp.]